MDNMNTTGHLHPTVKQYTESAAIAEEYDEYFRSSALFRFDCEFLASQLVPPGRILDAGCGTGRHLLFLQSLGFKTVGLDLSTNFLGIAKQKLKSYNYPVNRLVCGDLLNPPINNTARFEGILFMFSVLGLIKGYDNRVQILSKFKEFLAPNGKILMHVHNSEFSTSVIMQKVRKLRANLLAHEMEEEGDKVMRNYRGIQDLYLHSFSLKEIYNLMRDSGLKIDLLVALNAARDGVCESENVRRDANGFLISAKLL